MNEHRDYRVQQALMELDAALSSLAASTGIQTVVVIRDELMWSHRSISGLPGVSPEVPDVELLGYVGTQKNPETLEMVERKRAPVMTWQLADKWIEWGKSYNAYTQSDYGAWRKRLPRNGTLRRY